jgi:hypothetical protein
MHQGRVNELFVTVSNDGGASAADVLLRASLPLELAASGPNSERAIKSDELTWALGTIEPTGSREVRVRVEARSVSNQARIEFTVGDGGEPTHTSADVEIRATSNLAIETQCLDDSVDVGSQTPFVFQVTNHGPDLAKGVALVVTLPPELQAVDADGPTPFKIEGPESPEQASAPVSPSERAPNTKRQAWVGKQEPEAPAEGMKPDRQEVQKVIFEPIEGLDPKAVLTYRIRLKCVRPGNVRIAAKVNADEPLPKESVVDEIVVPCRSPRDLTHPPSSEPIPMSSY